MESLYVPMISDIRPCHAKDKNRIEFNFDQISTMEGFKEDLTQILNQGTQMLYHYIMQYCNKKIRERLMTGNNGKIRLVELEQFISKGCFTILEQKFAVHYFHYGPSYKKEENDVSEQKWDQRGFFPYGMESGFVMAQRDLVKLNLYLIDESIDEDLHLYLYYYEPLKTHPVYNKNVVWHNLNRLPDCKKNIKKNDSISFFWIKERTLI